MYMCGCQYLYVASAVGSTLPLFIRNGMYKEVAANR
jgi:hypothetical protein